jgi:hypothetical protein
LYRPQIVRPSRLVAGAALTAALAVAAVPAIAASAAPTAPTAIEPSAFKSIQVQAIAATDPTAAELDSAYAAAGLAVATTQFTEPGTAGPAPVAIRPQVVIPAAHSGSAQKPPRYSLSGFATFYANGTTAMRLPRGTTIIVCGRGGCLERTVSDYGPVASLKNRIIDLYTPDFFSVCGCPSWSGTTWVTVAVY